ncbi:retrovirus-related Pol polyprotein from transposon opus [Trichonephila clavipes]|nr:retrovirus-related Pol polyprotein from transposon opus [Trichonephila clavipes]
MLVCSSAYEALLENVQFIHNPAKLLRIFKGQLRGITADDPKSISSQEMTEKLTPLKFTYRLSLPGLAKVKGHNLKTETDFTPKKMHPYRIPIALQQEVDRQINELLHFKLIEPSESEWAHPIVCVSKRTEVSDYVLTTDI